MPGYSQAPLDRYDIFDNGYTNYYKLIKQNPAGGFVALGNDRTTIYYVNSQQNIVWTKNLGSYRVKSFEVSSAGVVHLISSYSSTTKYTRLSAASGTVLGTEDVYTLPAEVSALVIDSSTGNVYTIGSKYNGGQYDIEVNKYNSSGTKIWVPSKIYDSNNTNDHGYGISINSASQLALVGTNDENHLNIFESLVDKDGVLLWQNVGWQIAHDYDVNFRNIRLLNNGDVYVCVYARGAYSFNVNNLVIQYHQDGYGISYSYDIGSFPLIDFDVLENAQIYCIGVSSNLGGFLFGNLNTNSFLRLDGLQVGASFGTQYGGTLFVDRTKNEIYTGFVFDGNYDGGPTMEYSQFSKYDQSLGLQFTVKKDNYEAVAMAVDYQGSLIATTSGSTAFKFTPCTIVPLPQFTAQPAPKVSCPAQDVTFSVTATGIQLQYRWLKNGLAISDNSKISGSATNSLLIKAAQLDDAGNYSCEISDFCKLVISNAASLSFPGAPSISTQPQNLSQCIGVDAVFQVSSSGGQNVKYQWKKGTTTLVDGASVLGSKTTTLTLKTIAAGNGGDYTCEVTSDCFTVPTASQKATLTVLQQVTAISSSPLALSACAGTTANFAVTATGVGLTYQWKKGSTNLADDSRITGTKTNSLSLQAITAADVGSYSCVVTGTCGTSQTSLAAALTVTPISNISQQPVSKVVCLGGSTSFTIVASGAGLVYTWKKGTATIVNGGKYSGAATPTLSVTSVTSSEDGTYTCTINNPCGNDVVSSAAVLTVGTIPAITSLSANLKLCEGEISKMFITVSGGSFAYQWFKDGVALSESSNLVGTQTLQLIIAITTAADAGNYTCQVISACSTTQVSAIIKLEVTMDAEITNQPASQDKCTGDLVTFQITASQSVQSFQWAKDGIDLQNDGSIEGAQTATLIIKNVIGTDEGQYSCEIVSNCGNVFVSDAAALQINPKPDLELLDVDCNNFIPEWTSLVVDNNDVFGTYSLYEKGSSEPILDLHSIRSTGIYLIIKNSSQCADTVEWDNTCIVTGIYEAPPKFTVSPNPSSGIFFIHHPATLPAFEVYDIMGKRVSVSSMPLVNETRVEGNHLASGVYTIVTRTPEGVPIFLRIIIAR